MTKLEKCPHCGSDVILCNVAYVVAIVCPGCWLETKMMMIDPRANACFDMEKAVDQMVGKWNRREAQ